MFVLPSLVALRATAARAVRPVAGFARKLANRRAVTRLGELDERALKDIGLTRVEVLGALAAPLTEDPSRILAEHVHGGAAVERASHIRAVSAVRALPAGC